MPSAPGISNHDFIFLSVEDQFWDEIDEHCRSHLLYEAGRILGLGEGCRVCT